MKYVNYSVKKTVNNRIPMIIGAFLAALICLILTFQVFPKGGEVKTQVAEQKKIISQTEELRNTTASNEAAVSSAVKETGKKVTSAINTNQLITDVGVMANKHQLSIDKLATDAPAALSDGDLSYIACNIELRGTISEIEGFLVDLNNCKYVNKINSMSYRMDGQTYLWMYRAIDDETPISWFDISDYEKDEGNKEEEKTPLDSETMLKHGIVTCYLQIIFIGMM